MRSIRRPCNGHHPCASSPVMAAGQQNATSGFIELQSVTLCSGPYSPALARQWHAWDAAHGSENSPVDAWAPDQLFAMFITADGGVDLEHFVLGSFEEARSALLQVRTCLLWGGDVRACL